MEAEILQNRQDKIAGPILWTQRDRSHAEEDAGAAGRNWASERILEKAKQSRDACSNFGFPVLHSNNTPYN